MAETRLTAEIIFGNESVIISDNILEAHFGALDRGSVSELVDYGIYANNGNLSFIDREKKFKTLYDKSKENTGQVVFWLGNKVTRIATFNIENSLFNDETKQVDIELVSPLLNFQEIKVQRVSFWWNESLFYKNSLAYIVKFLGELFGINFNIKTDRLKYTVVYCTDIEDDTLWGILTKICQIAMCNIFDDEYGYPCICDTMPKKTNYVLNPNKIIEIGSQEISKIPNASISVTDRVKHIDEFQEGTEKSFSLYDYQGNVVDFEQDVSIDEWTDAANYHSARISYNIKFPNPTFAIGKVQGRCNVDYN